MRRSDSPSQINVGLDFERFEKVLKKFSSDDTFSSVFSLQKLKGIFQLKNKIRLNETVIEIELRRPS